MRRTVDLLAVAVVAALGLWNLAEPLFLSSPAEFRLSLVGGAVLILVAAANLARRATATRLVSRVVLLINVVSLGATFTLAAATGMPRAWVAVAGLLVLTVVSLPPPEVVLGRARG